VEPTSAESQDTTALTAPETQATEAQAVEPQIPESYEFQMPEGVEIDQDAVQEFSGLAKELKLDQANAQKVADIAVKMMAKQTEQHQNLVTSWTEQTKADKEFGGDRLNENLAVAKKALDTFGTPELRDVLNMTGLGNHPEVIRAFYRAGKAISEDRFISGSPKGAEVDPARRLFPSMN
jgi:hypothetical protein